MNREDHKPRICVTCSKIFYYKYPVSKRPSQYYAIPRRRKSAKTCCRSCSVQSQIDGQHRYKIKMRKLKQELKCHES